MEQLSSTAEKVVAKTILISKSSKTIDLFIFLMVYQYNFTSGILFHFVLPVLLYFYSSLL